MAQDRRAAAGPQPSQELGVGGGDPGRGPAQPYNASVLSVLTDREREVLARVAAGMSNDEIAAALFMSPLTAKTHVNRTMTKLGARDRAQLVVIAYETGLARPGLP